MSLNCNTDGIRDLIDAMENFKRSYSPMFGLSKEEWTEYYTQKIEFIKKRFGMI